MEFSRPEPILISGKRAGDFMKKTASIRLIVHVKKFAQRTTRAPENDPVLTADFRFVHSPDIAGMTCELCGSKLSFCP